MTAGDPTRRHQGQSLIAWHFLKDQGHFHMLDLGQHALMFRGSSTTDQFADLDLTRVGLAATP